MYKVKLQTKTMSYWTRKMLRIHVITSKLSRALTQLCKEGSLPRRKGLAMLNECIKELEQYQEDFDEQTNSEQHGR